jgi:hypothetical protein
MGTYIAILVIGICVGWVISRIIVVHTPKNDPKPQDDFLPPVDVRHINKWD